MQTDQIYTDLINDFNLKDLSNEERENFLLEISKTVQKQFLYDVYEILGEEKFNALEASSSMGEEFYATTLKHVLPNYEEVFLESRKKVAEKFKNQ